VLTQVLEYLRVVIVVRRLTVVLHHVPSGIGLEVTVGFQILFVIGTFSLWVYDAIQRLSIPAVTPRLWIQRNLLSTENIKTKTTNLNIKQEKYFGFVDRHLSSWREFDEFKVEWNCRKLGRTIL